MDNNILNACRGTDRCVHLPRALRSRARGREGRDEPRAAGRRGSELKADIGHVLAVSGRRAERRLVIQAAR